MAADPSDIYWPAFCGNNSNYDAFWSNQLTLNTSNPDLTICFQRTILTWPPAAFMLIFTPIHLWYYWNRTMENRLLDFSRINLIRTVVCLVMVLTSLLMVIWAGRPMLTGEIYASPADYVATSLRLASMVAACAMLRWDHMKGVHTSVLLSFYWLLLLLMEIPQCYSNVMRRGTVGAAAGEAYFVAYNTFFAFLILQFLLTFFVDRTNQAVAPEGEEVKTSQGDAKHQNTAKPCPHDKVCFWGKLSFLWLTKDIIQGYRKVINFDSLYALRKEDKCKALLNRFSKSYFTVNKGKVGSETPTGKRPHRPLSLAILMAIGKDMGLGITLRIISIPIEFFKPQLLRILIDFIESGDSENWKGIAIIIGMLIVNFTYTIDINYYLHYVYSAGMKARSIVNAVVYRKALRLSSMARKQTTMGQVVSLMSVDAQKIQDLYLFCNLLWSMPITIVLCIYFLWQTIGPSCLAGLGVLLLFLPLNMVYLANKTYKLQKEQMVEKDKRFKVMNEVLSGMKVLKLYAWEPSFENKITGFRNKELKTIKYINYINAFGSMTSLLAPYLVSLAIFTTYMLIDENNVLTASKAFVTLSLINMLNFPLSFLPLCVANTSQGIVSVRRVGRFLDLEEWEEDVSQQDPTLKDNGIEITNANLSWGRDEGTTLKDITVKVPNGGLVAVVGSIGSGKSSLLSAILGEMFRTSGDIKYKGNLAYVPQQAWILHNSLKENVTFSKPFEKNKYDDIVKACALTQDLAMLPGGDETEVGEKGVNLSGGQKQRVSLARAVYQDKDIYLLDDPLSAVDAHVGKHIFEHVIGPKGLLKEKTRVLVTHGITYLPDCDHIIVLKDGKIEDSGSYEQLTSKEGPFADVLHSYLNQEGDEHFEEEAEAIREVISRISSVEGEDGKSISLPQFSRNSSHRQKMSRASSRRSETTKMAIAANGAQLIKEEKEQEGTIGVALIKSYVKACGYWMMNWVFWSHLLYMTFQILTNIWLSAWTEDKPVNGSYERSQSLYRVSVYGYLGIGQTLSALVEAFAVAHGCYVGSSVLHSQLLKRIMRAPMAFFDTTPLGRIMNRFAKDVDVLDANMPLFIRQWLFAVSPVIVTIVLICYSTPIFAVVIIPLTIVYILLQRMYVVSMRQWKRIDSVRRSPIYTHFDESVVGASSIRAYRKEKEFISTCDQFIDESQRPWFLVITALRWCSIVMEFLGACVVLFSSLFAVLQRDVISSGQAGLSVSYALQVTIYLSSVVRMSSELETYIVSVERINEYLDIDSEAPWENQETEPLSTWPETGAVQFTEYSTRYREGLDLVLKRLHFSVLPGERIGIVGRTGAGKSSLSLALFRIIEAAAGGIYIDGRQVSEMGLHDLRRQISIIPQDPVVFSGSMRSNLDPFNLYSDLEVWESLEHAHLKAFVTETDEGLEYECGENGEALSVGQRQLLCLARALLRKSKILVLDEATAAVDFETDSLIQTTIREKFKHCTILTVAHRLHTVLDYDRIMVLEKGKIIELDSPNKLLADETTVFHSMAKDAGLI